MSHNKIISQVQTLYMSTASSEVRVAVLDVWSLMSYFTCPLPILFLCTYPQPENENSSAESKRGSHQLLSCSMTKYPLPAARLSAPSISLYIICTHVHIRSHRYTHYVYVIFIYRYV